MRVHRLWPVTAWLLAASSLLSPVVSGDVIRVHNTANDDVGALVDGLRAGIAVNDARYLKLNLGGFINGLFPIVPLEEFTPAPQSNEAIVFARGRPPLLLDNLNWSVFDDTIHANFDDEYAIDVRIWIVHGPFETVRNVALNAGVVTSTIWEHERQGIKFSNFEVTDATDDPDAPGLLDFPPFCEGAEELQTRIGFEPGMVNIYYVRTVDFGSGPGTTSGVWCGSERIIAMGYQTSGPLLAHELGHSFFLGHLSPWPEHFDTSNVMEHSSPNREFLTEGQTFRTVYQPLSSINNIYDVRTGKPTRNCPQGVSDTDLDCPGLHKRLWEDGAAWPPN